MSRYFLSELLMEVKEHLSNGSRCFAGACLLIVQEMSWFEIPDSQNHFMRKSYGIYCKTTLGACHVRLS